MHPPSEHERGLALASGEQGAAPPIALQLKNFSESSGAGMRVRQTLPQTLRPTLARKRPRCGHPQEGPTQTTRGGRTVHKPNYKD